LDFEEMAKLAKMMKIVSETNNSMSTEEKFLKIILSYLKPEQKKNAEVIIKYIEFENMAKKHKNKISAQNIKNENWQKNMLTELRNSFTGKKQLKIDMILKFMDLKDTFEKINT